ncbi:MAG: succinyl-diaminopimelate desuccinylase [Alphaproteobacteria bacterium]|nr:succinyl-diaminopimelate desuccinylase [Alphaproteobacteria bacterium]MBP7759508.1 succinyl-diaminopimelate desuccinylase [Alphaproteobacteria bacterium]MBP7762920.1 succinyl-diaminopimelate desuccinylase [Alphaproteobacteria bacterium]MBP7905196.1 succinyl-diaminopimelate desuccinylase [Alphaproteobacteria bacterium]
MSYDVLSLAQGLIRCPSVTPEDAGAQLFLAEKLSTLGFSCHHLPFEEVPNLFARYGTGGKHLCFAGHTDVVPTGPEQKWTYPPFGAEIHNGILYGRGAADMKGAVAAFAAAAASFIERKKNFDGSISLLITGDEEGPAVNGTVRVLEWMKEHGHLPDVALVGEPTNPDTLGQEIKIGRRGSLSGTLRVAGKQGHVAYPHLAHNPLPPLIKMLDTLSDHVFDKGSAYFPQTNLEITTIDVGNPASNVIPSEGHATFNIRFNDRWSSETISQKIVDILDKVKHPYELELSCGAESFITRPGDWSALVLKAVQDITGKKAEYTTNGGTSDARFIVNYCPVVEFGAINASIHQIDEHAPVKDLEDLTRIYERLLMLYFF